MEWRNNQSRVLSNSSFIMHLNFIIKIFFLKKIHKCKLFHFYNHSLLPCISCHSSYTRMNGHTPQVRLHHTTWVHLSRFFKLCQLCLKICSQTQVGGSTSSPPLQWEGLQEVTHCMKPTPGMSEWDSAGSEGNTRKYLVGKHAEAMPKLCLLYSTWARPARFCLRLLGWNSQLWRGLGRGGEENVVFIQLWNTNCDSERIEKNINSDAKANFQMAHQNSFFFFFICFVNITRQIHSVNIYTIQYVNHRGGKKKPPCHSFPSVFSVLLLQKDCLKSRGNFVVHKMYFSFNKNAMTCKKIAPGD